MNEALEVLRKHAPGILLIVVYVVMLAVESLKSKEDELKKGDGDEGDGNG